VCVDLSRRKHVWCPLPFVCIRVIILFMYEASLWFGLEGCMWRMMFMYVACALY